MGVTEDPEIAAYRELMGAVQVRRGLYLIRLPEVRLEDPFHRAIVYTLAYCDPGAQDGDLITAMRFTIDHALLDTGRVAVAAKQGADRMLSRDVGRVMREERISRAAAERDVKDSDAYWDLREQAEMAALEKQYYRELLESLQAALDNHRTTRADQRQADSFHAQTAT